MDFINIKQRDQGTDLNRQKGFNILSHQPSCLYDAMVLVNVLYNLDKK